MDKEGGDKDEGEAGGSASSDGRRVIVVNVNARISRNGPEDDEDLWPVLSLFPVLEFPDSFEADVKHHDWQDQEPVDYLAHDVHRRL